ncbi:hypothetical protein [Candidatus Neomicrothrix sp.]|uniref:hypothetical protein n=1 Tax=Candidatus Neomicrothrix sp. TaxID=2719034 RepID=UPI001B4D88D7|nr:hypothetical protein [Candidatus Microthrix sp.]MBP7988834.1 hypothetical protein [Candidatus Microthrix sp.]
MSELPIADDVFKGGTITGNQCFEGAAADLEGLVGYLDNPFEFPDDSTIFVAIR